MSNTINHPTPADFPRNTKLGLFDLLCTARSRARASIGKATGYVAMLALLAIGACEGAGGTATAALATTTCPGSISLAWSITSASGQPATCAQVGATSVALRLLSRTGGAPVFTAFPCAGSPGTANVAPGLYDAAIELHDANGTRLATAPPQNSVPIAIGRTKVLAPATFTVGPGGGGTSRIALTLEAQNVGSNCQPTSTGGAGITGTTVTIVRVGGGCAAATLIRSRGGTQIGNYQVNCSSPEVATCIERDETLTSTSPLLAPGSYVMRVRGLVGPVECWTAEAQLDVPAVGQLQRRIVLQRQTAPGC
jgi:hypothetical protein